MNEQTALLLVVFLFFLSFFFLYFFSSCLTFAANFCFCGYCCCYCSVYKTWPFGYDVRIAMQAGGLGFTVSAKYAEQVILTLIMYPQNINELKLNQWELLGSLDRFIYFILHVILCVILQMLLLFLTLLISSTIYPVICHIHTI